MKSTLQSLRLRAISSIVATSAAALSATSCGGTPVASNCSTSSCETMSVVVSELSFVKHNPDTTIEGFDLDHDVTTGTYPSVAGCGHADQRSYSGDVGIDNELALTFETIDSLTNGAVDGLVKMAINMGTLLILFRIEGVDDPTNDSSVTVFLMKGSTETAPLIATTGYLAPSQTFGIDNSTPISRGEGYIENGVLHAGPFEAVIPLKIFGVSANIRIHGARLRGEVNVNRGLGDAEYAFPQDGGVAYVADAIMGGGIEVEQILDIARQAGAMDHNAAMIAESAEVFLHAGADLAWVDDLGQGEGGCSQISAALRFRSEPAFLLGDTP